MLEISKDNTIICITITPSLNGNSSQKNYKKTRALAVCSMLITWFLQEVQWVYHIMLWLLQTGSTIKVRMKKIIWRFFGVVHFLFQSKNIQNNIFSLKSAVIIKIFSLGRKNNIAIKKQRPRCRLPIVSATENKARTSSSSQIESSQVIFI